MIGTYGIQLFPECQNWIQLSCPDFSVELGSTCVGALQYFQLSDDAAARHSLRRSIDVLRQSKVSWRVRFWERLSCIDEVLPHNMH